MEYVKNPNFYEGNILRAADLVSMENAILQNQSDISIIKNTSNDWDETDATSAGYINNKPLSYKAKTYTWNGNSYNSIFFEINANKIENNAPNKEVFINGSLSAIVDGIPYSNLIIERICNTRMEITDFFNDNTAYHALIVNGLAFNFPAMSSVIALVGKEELYALAVLMTETTIVDGDRFEKGFYLLNAPDFYGSGKSAYCSALAFTDIIIKEQYESFFKQFENNIRIVQISNVDDMINYQLFKPGDIVYSVIDMSTAVGDLMGAGE